MRIDMDPAWEEHILAAVDVLFAEKLGPRIEADAKRYAPVRTGALRESIGHHVEDHTLVVDATVDYAAYVEMGHRIAHGPGMKEVGPKVKGPMPYLRPALMQERGE